MRIAIDIRTLSDGNSGIQVYLTQILNRLQVIDNKNEYFLFERISSGYTVSNPLWKVITKRFWVPGLIWVHFVLPLMLLFYRANCLWAPSIIAPLFLPKSITLYYTVYDLTFLRYPEVMEHKQFKTVKLFFNSALKKATNVFVISAFMKNEIASFYPRASINKVRIAPCGAPEPTIPETYNANQRKNYLFSPGNLEPRKNLINLIKALEMPFLQEFKIDLLLTGNNKWKSDALFEHIEKSPIRDRIKLQGHLTQRQLERCYLECKALIYPSIYEGFGMPVLEALSFDCVVLTSKGTVMEEVCEDCAMYFDPNDVQNIADCIHLLYDPSFNRRRYLTKSKEICKKYDWHRTALTIKNAFES